MNTRSGVSLRMGTNEDPSQMMPSLGGPPPSSNLPPYTSGQLPRIPIAGGGGVGAPWGSTTGGGMYGGGMGGGATYGGVPHPSGNSSFERRRSSFEMQELREKLQGQGGQGPGLYPQQYQQQFRGGGHGDEDSGLSCVSDGPNKGGSDAEANSRLSNQSLSRMSNQSLNRQALGALQQPAGSNMSGGSNGSNRSLSSTIAATAASAECRRFTAVQLYKATDSFAESNILGHGAFGSVFKGRLMGCQVAVKRLEGGGWQGPNEYRTEVEVLSRMRHPHIVLLMGHCPEEHCLVYEYLPGGSLQDFLNPAKRRRQILWAERVRVMAEITSALLYLHHHEPPIAHRDLKPDNVLLDINMTSKLGDVGLARLVVEEDNMTARVRGTAGYIDPEEVVTCEVSVLSDIYAFGLIALQLMLGEPNVKMVQKLLVECANSSGGTLVGRGLSMAADTIMSRLDTTCGSWNRDIVRPLVVMALRCSDPKRVRRPDITEEIQPALQRAAEEAALETQKQRAGLEAQLICPLSQTQMIDPVVAADGFTYERSAIETWLSMNDSSPSTGEPMLHKFLTPNNGLKHLLESQ